MSARASKSLVCVVTAAASAGLLAACATTSQRLAAAVDERAGTEINSLSKWQGVQEAYDYWAQKLKKRLAEFPAK